MSYTETLKRLKRLQAREKRPTQPVIILVQCRDCQHFTPDAENPDQGIGRCKVDADGDRPPWPNAPRRCDRFDITRAGIFRHARAACRDTQVDPSELTTWLIDQGDPNRLVPAAIRRWAELIAERGYPE